MKRKRAPGGGRKAQAGPTSSLTFRIPDDMRKQLEREAAEKEVNVSDRLHWHLRRSFNRQRDEERDPALQALLLLIARLAEVITGGEYIPDKDLRSDVRSEWAGEANRVRLRSWIRVVSALGERERRSAGRELEVIVR